MANESLIFRKGLQSKIKDLAIKPGAISITIDEPGMYIDLPANASLGHATDYRVRIGDVITVKTLGALADLDKSKLKPENLTDDLDGTNPASLDGRISAYSTSALYYVADQNMLLKYDSDKGHFVWINDTTSLQTTLASLTSTVNNIGTRLTNLEKEVGDPKTSTNAATGLYKYIDDADKNLQDQIDAITGGSGVSLETLQAAIEQEAKDRAAGDTALDSKITDINSKFANYSTTTQMNAAIKTAKDDLTTAIGTAKQEAINTAASDAAAKVKTEKERAEAAEETLRESITSVSTSLNDYAKKADVYTKTEIDTTVSGLNTAIDTAEADANKYTDAEIGKIDTAYKAADTALDEKITGVSNNLTQNYYNKTSIDSKVTTINQAITDAQANATTNAVSQAKTYTDTQVAAEKKRAEEAEAGLAEQIQQLSTSTSGTYATKQELTDAVDNLEGQIATAKTGAETTAKAYTDAEIAKIDAAYKAADKTLKESLESQVQTVSNNLKNNYYTSAQIDTKVTTINNAISKAQTDATAAAKTYTDTEIGKIDTAYKAADTALKNELNETISGVSTNLANNYYKKTETYDRTEIDNKDAATLQAAKDHVASLLRAAEAMRYMGTLTTANPMTEVTGKTGVEAGDVWVVSTISADGVYKPGDMLIAKVDGANTAANWNHVKTGYDASLEQKLLSTIDNSGKNNGGKVEIDSVGTLDVGSVSFKAAADSSGNYTTAARVTMTTDKDGSGNNSTVTIGMVWTDF